MIKIGKWILLASLLFLIVMIVNYKSQNDEWMKDPKKVNSYQIEGNIQIDKGEETRNYDMVVQYLKEHDGYYKVSLLDKELNQEQIILRNKEGVFVITPNLNQIYQFEGNWPFNSQKPYMLETIYQVLQQKDNQIKKNKQGYEIIAKINDQNNKSYQYQVMTFDQDRYLKQINIVDDKQHSLVKVNFKTIRYDCIDDANVFNVPSELKVSVESEVINEADLPMYPMNVLDSSLVNVYELKMQNETKHVLEYKGNKEFTIVQSKIKVKEQLQKVVMSYELYDTLTFCGYYDGQSMSMNYGGVEFSVYGKDLDPDSMIDILSSMRMVVLK